MSDTTEKTFWEKRTEPTMIGATLSYFLLPLYALVYLSGRSREMQEALNEPYRRWLYDFLGWIAPIVEGRYQIPLIPIYRYWAFGQGAWIALAIPPFLIAGFLWFVGFNIITAFSRPPMSTSHGSGRFATKAEQKRFLRGSRTALLVGASAKRGFFHYDGPEHLLTLAPTRSGKGASVIIPNLLHAERSVIVIDPKGENVQVTARHRKTFGHVHVLDPFNVSGQANASFNPLAGLDAANPDFVDDAATLAAALVVTPPQSRDQHFDDGARSLLRGLIMLVAAVEIPDRRNLVTLRDYLTYPREKFAGLLEIMAEMTEADGAIAAAANVFRSKNDREAAAILSTAQEQTSFLDSPQLRASLKTSSFEFGDLKTGIASVFIVLPQSRLASHGRWVRLLVTRALQDIERTRVKPKAPVLFLLDEFASVGDMPAIKTAFGLMAGYGLQLWAFLQNWGQLEELYGKGAHTFVANAGVFQTFNTNDELTARYVSNLSGDTTRAETADRSRSIGGKLLTPEEVMHLGPNTIFLKLKGVRPFFVRKVQYWTHRRFKGLHDASDFN
ncbi:type IV secretory system conjugative DNA transfer family protein [Aureimonas pseudogalii]|uniref:Type IV secretion system protein VirD4 n=1 Tax=Aureimonas pseudogalii TaxID=1744844 RepID=A0A7W6H7X9_9HYPH|nr:type IV secretory system conjugative DNA transfer family protein [Aureimonas pseudogalii]MBB4000251.1 type IV secretion system protein VirD4 [Aureimonas pseudogalii]